MLILSGAIAAIFYSQKPGDSDVWWYGAIAGFLACLLLAFLVLIGFLFFKLKTKERIQAWGLLPKTLSTQILVLLVVLNFLLFFFFLTMPYYCFLGAGHYTPKGNPAWGFVMPNSPEAWFFFVLAFVFLAFWAVTFVLLIWKRSDIFQKGIHPTYKSE